MTDFPQQYAQALEEAAGDPIALTEGDSDAVLDLAREVAHASERRFAPLATYLAGRFVARRAEAGVPVERALAEAAAVARLLLEDGDPGSGHV